MTLLEELAIENAKREKAESDLIDLLVQFVSVRNMTNSISINEKQRLIKFANEANNLNSVLGNRILISLSK